jgi:two-component sensor histidine kinase
MGLLGISRDITENKLTAKKENEYIRSLEFLKKTAMRFVELSPEDDIYQFIAEKLRELASNSIVVIAAFDKAVPCGLITDELISNSLKHAFPATSTRNEQDALKRMIRIALHPDNGDRLALTISDKGIGLPTDLDFRETDSLGLQLVTTLVDQLDGKLDSDRENGTMFRITFRESHKHQEDR